MRIVVVSRVETPSQRADVINTVRMAQGFARLGHEVTFICHRGANGKVPPEQLKEIYGLTDQLRWVQLPKVSLRRIRKVTRHWIFALSVLPFILREKPDLVFARDFITPYLTSRFGIPTVAECHMYVGMRWPPFLHMIKGTHHAEFRLLVTISHHLADYYHSLGAPKEKMVVLPTGVNVEHFQRPSQLPPSPYPDDKPNVAYVGHLFDWKGIPTILKSAECLPDVNFHLVGGFPEDQARQQVQIDKMGLSNVTLHGLRPQSEVPRFLWHADVLLLPPSANHPTANWTSPVKLGEYLASGTPVVATSIPALQDWLTDEEVQFIEPDNAQAMVEGIKAVLDDKERTKARVEAGLQKARRFSYVRRAETILRRCKL